MTSMESRFPSTEDMSSRTPGRSLLSGVSVSSTPFKKCGRSKVTQCLPSPGEARPDPHVYPTKTLSPPLSPNSITE
jgi:hypothetical protein